jgi:hypothetical protein
MPASRLPSTRVGDVALLHHQHHDFCFRIRIYTPRAYKVWLWAPCDAIVGRGVRVLLTNVYSFVSQPNSHLACGLAAGTCLLTYKKRSTS